MTLYPTYAADAAQGLFNIKMPSCQYRNLCHRVDFTTISSCSGVFVNIDLVNSFSPVRARPLPEPMLTDCQLDPREQTVVNF